MGRFKIYDPNKLVNILNDTNYAKCLMCQRKLKNIMGNIKRHYEQMHSMCVDADDNKRKNSKKKVLKYDEDEDFKLKKPKKRNAKRKLTIGKDRTNRNRLCDMEPPKSFPDERTVDHGRFVAPTTTTMEDVIVNKRIEIIPKVYIKKDNNNASSENNNTSTIKIRHETTAKDIQSNDCSLMDHKTESLESEVFAVEDAKMKLGNEKVVNTTEFDNEKQQFNFKKIKFNNQNNEIETVKLCNNSYINHIQINSCQQDESFKSIVQTQTLLNIPLANLKEGYTFQKTLQSLSDNIQFNFTPQNIGEIIDRLVKKLRKKIIEIVGNRLVYLKLDIANSGESKVMLVNIQLIKDFEVKVITLSALELLDDGHFATYLKEKVISTLKQYQIDISRVHSITRDSSNNFKGSPNDLDQEEESELMNHLEYRDYCQHLSEEYPGHGIHFVAYDILKQLNENISQSRDSVKSLVFKMSQLNIKEDMPVLDNCNSWFSIYDMIKSLIKIREKVENNSLLSVEVDWLFAIKFETSFRPIIDIALILLSNNNFVMGDLYREWLLCEAELEELSETNELALYMLQALRKRKEGLFENTSFLTALYLDPRFCYMGSTHLNVAQKDIAISQLLQLFNKLKSLPEIKNDTYSSLSNHNLKDRYLKLETKFAHSMTTNHKHKTKTLNNSAASLNNVDTKWLKETLEQLQFEERLPYNANILNYWKTIKYRNPILAKIAEIGLAAPATQATINRALNAWPMAIMKRKLNITSNHIENLLLLQLNQDLVDKIPLEE